MIALSEKSQPAVGATLPVAGEHIDEIAKRFYGHLFGEHHEHASLGLRPDLWQADAD